MDQSNTLSKHKLHKFRINDVESVYYKSGNGPQALLIIPGTFSKVTLRLKELIEYFDADKYTVVAWDPPGFGLSWPPHRDFSQGFYHRDADVAISLMESLQLDKYSVLGWCAGGIAALIIASKVADRVEKIVIWGTRVYVTREDVDIYEGIRDFNKWPEFNRQIYIDNYGEEYSVRAVSAFIDAFRWPFDHGDGNICREVLPFVNAPTLVLHGAKDFKIPVEHPVYLQKNIKLASLKIFPDAEHDIHRSHPKEFNETVDRFLNNNE